MIAVLDVPLTIFAVAIAVFIIIVAIAIVRTERRSSGWTFFIGFRTDTSKEHIDRDGNPVIDNEQEAPDPNR